MGLTWRRLAVSPMAVEGHATPTLRHGPTVASHAVHTRAVDASRSRDLPPSQAACSIECIASPSGKRNIPLRWTRLLFSMTRTTGKVSSAAMLSAS